MKERAKRFELWGVPAALAITASMLMVCGCGNKYEKALSLFEQEKWQEALAEAEKTPKEDAKLQYHIGLAYANGFGGLEKNRKTALSWYEKSAAQNCINGLLACAQYYATGDGGATKDEKKAHNFTERAAELGSMEAKCNLGFDYLNGTGVTKDEAKAVQLIRESADAGYDHGMFITGMFYKDGKQVKKDLVEALKWFEAAAAKGSRKAMFELAYAYGLADRCEYHLQRDFPKALENLKKSADLKLPYAQRLYGVFLMSKNYMGVPVKDGEGIRPDDAREGSKYIIAAAEQGDEKAMFIAGKLYWEGASFYSVSNDSEKAYAYWKNGAAKGDKSSKEMIEAFKKCFADNVSFAHTNLQPVAEMNSLCGFTFGESGISKCEKWNYKFDQDGSEWLDEEKLEHNFRRFNEVSLHYAPITKTLYKIVLNSPTDYGKECDRLAEYAAVRETITKKYGVLPRAEPPETYPADIDKVVLFTYKWAVNGATIELRPGKYTGELLLSATSTKHEESSKLEKTIWKSMKKKVNEADVL